MSSGPDPQPPPYWYDKANPTWYDTARNNAITAATAALGSKPKKGAGASAKNKYNAKLAEIEEMKDDTNYREHQVCPAIKAYLEKPPYPLNWSFHQMYQGFSAFFRDEVTLTDTYPTAVGPTGTKYWLEFHAHVNPNNDKIRVREDDDNGPQLCMFTAGIGSTHSSDRRKAMKYGVTEAWTSYNTMQGHTDTGNNFKSIRDTIGASYAGAHADDYSKDNVLIGPFDFGHEPQSVIGGGEYGMVGWDKGTEDEPNTVTSIEFMAGFVFLIFILCAIGVGLGILSNTVMQRFKTTRRVKVYEMEELV